VFISEGFCVGLLARSADSKCLRFAKIVVKYARQRLRTTIALYSSLMKVYAYSGMYTKACDLYGHIRETQARPDDVQLPHEVRCVVRPR
jgi:pentatricopeptide repeat protein